MLNNRHAKLETEVGGWQNVNACRVKLVAAFVLLGIATWPWTALQLDVFENSSCILLASERLCENKRVGFLPAGQAVVFRRSSEDLHASINQGHEYDGSSLNNGSNPSAESQVKR